MWLSKIEISNFRKISSLTINFPRGLSVIVGENNSGKTTVLDALRLMLFPGRDFNSLRLSEDDFKAGANQTPIELSCTFSNLSSTDEVHFQECLVELSEGEYEMRITSRVEFNANTNRCNVKTWGGETEGGVLPSTFYDYIATIYLQPLRDPERGLKPGQNSQISRLINSIAKDNQHQEFVDIAVESNEKIRALNPVIEAKSDINSQMRAITGGELTQNTELIFSDPVFRRIISGLYPQIDGLPFTLNGLGYNNLIYASTTLGTLRRSSHYSYRNILIEEPEAHLHPQLQVLLLRHLTEVTRDVDNNEVQVIASSHSPILASQAPIDSIIALHEIGDVVSAVSVFETNIEPQMKKKLQRFLDVTRAELFFARRIIMVEGIAEALLFPVLAEIAGGDLKDSAVTIVNADGINFNAFLPLFGESRINIPLAIVTDGDASRIGEAISATASSLKAKEQDIPKLTVQMSEITFEHELARSPEIFIYMVQAFGIMHPVKVTSLQAELDEHQSQDEKADIFLRYFLDTQNTSKGRFSQELAYLLDGADIQSTSIPQYIRNVFIHLDVVREGD